MIHICTYICAHTPTYMHIYFLSCDFSKGIIFYRQNKSTNLNGTNITFCYIAR